MHQANIKMNDQMEIIENEVIARYRGMRRIPREKSINRRLSTTNRFSIGSVNSIP